MELNSKDFKIIPKKLIPEILLILASDLISFGITFAIVTIIRYILFHNLYGNIVDSQVIRTIMYVVIATVFLLFAKGLYPGWRRSSVMELEQLVETITIAYVLIAVVIFISGSVIEFSRTVFIFSWFFGILLLPVDRFLIRKFIARFSWWGEPVVIIGTDDQISRAALRLISCQRLGLRPAVGLSVDSKNQYVKYRIPIIPWSPEAQTKIKSSGIYTNILAIPTDELRQDYPKIFDHIWLSFNSTVFLLNEDIYGIMMAQPIDILGHPAIISKQSLLEPLARFTKELAEFVLILILALPVLIIGVIIALLIKLDSPGPVFFIHERIGAGGKPFNLIKFRTMVVNADEILNELLLDPKLKKVWETHHKFAADRRVTRVGKWLRKLSLDELPQFLNVVHGEMALIGPRPLVQAEIDEIGEPSTMILRIHPGITGWWQVMGRNALSFEERTQFDLYYVYNWSLWLDMFISIKTIWVILFGPTGEN